MCVPALGGGGSLSPPLNGLEWRDENVFVDCGGRERQKKGEIN